jgi:hypothetical protein
MPDIMPAGKFSSGVGAPPSGASAANADAMHAASTTSLRRARGRKIMDAVIAPTLATDMAVKRTVFSAN